MSAIFQVYWENNVIWRNWSHYLLTFFSSSELLIDGTLSQLRPGSGDRFEALFFVMAWGGKTRTVIQVWSNMMRVSRLWQNFWANYFFKVEHCCQPKCMSVSMFFFFFTKRDSTGRLKFVEREPVVWCSKWRQAEMFTPSRQPPCQALPWSLSSAPQSTKCPRGVLRRGRRDFLWL